MYAPYERESIVSISWNGEEVGDDCEFEIVIGTSLMGVHPPLANAGNETGRGSPGVGANPESGFCRFCGRVYAVWEDVKTPADRAGYNPIPAGRSRRKPTQNPKTSAGVRKGASITILYTVGGRKKVVGIPFSNPRFYGARFNRVRASPERRSF
jgi:hypothetical protein